jgi:putative ABC transport system substrate-binding protein
MRGTAVVVVVAMSMAVASALAADNAQQPERVRRVGMLFSKSAAEFQMGIDAFRAGLRERGWVDGQNIVIELRPADGHYDRLPRLAAELVRLPVDVIFAPALVTAIAAKAATTSVPIVFWIGPDPVQVGLIDSLARPGGNITGIAGFMPEVTAKQLELLKEAAPHIGRVALLVNPDNPNAPPAVERVEQEARNLKLQLQVVHARDDAELQTAFDRMARSGTEAVVVVPDALFYDSGERIARLAIDRRFALAAPQLMCDAGALLTYGISPPAEIARSAYFVDRILKGAKPAELPVERPTKFILTINLRVAKAIGVVVHDGLLKMADEVVQENGGN